MFGSRILGEKLIRKPIAKNNERYPYTVACQRLLKPEAKLVICVCYEDGSVGSVGLNLKDKAEAATMLTYAKQGLGDTGRDLFNLLNACNKVWLQGHFLNPVAGVVLVLMDEGRGIATGWLNIGETEAKRAIDMAKDGITGGPKTIV